jgi:hypothetical protein
MWWWQRTAMTTGVSPLESILFFYTFFVVLVIFLLYGLWEMHKAQVRMLPNPLSAALLGIPDSINLFDNTQATLRVENCSKTTLKKVHVMCGNSWAFSLEPQSYRDIPIKLDTLYAGNHKLTARVYCKQWELRIFCWYRVFQYIPSKKEKYLKILGLRPGATREDIKKARNRLAKKYHPDVEEGHEEKMKEINEAYQRLMAA